MTEGGDSQDNVIYIFVYLREETLRLGSSMTEGEDS